MSEQLCIIYKSTNLINGKCYVGKTTQSLHKRRQGHKDSVESKSNTYFHRAIKKYGLGNFKWEILYECDDALVLGVMETMKIIVNHSHWTEGGYNLTWGGDGIPKGYKFSKEIIEKRSLSMIGKYTGELSYMFGKTIPSDVRKKISISLLGRKKSDETKKKMSKSAINKTFSLTTREKMSISAKNKHPMTKETKEKMSKSRTGMKRGPMSDEHKRKISESMKRSRVTIIDFDTLMEMIK